MPIVKLLNNLHFILASWSIFTTKTKYLYSQFYNMSNKVLSNRTICTFSVSVSFELSTVYFALFMFSLICLTGALIAYTTLSAGKCSAERK